MSTRCSIHFCSNKRVVANIYRHCDGYPEGVLPDLEKFFKAVQTQCGEDTRFTDPSYLAAKFVVWQSGQYARGGSPLNFLSLGIANDDADVSYVYKVHCDGDFDTKVPKVTHSVCR